MNFVAVDVETANSDLASICQIGVVVFEDGRPKETWQSLINPEDEFHWANVKVHGIQKQDVADSPTIPQVHKRLEDLLTGRAVVHHGAFDRISLGRATSKYQLPEITCTWIDTTKVVRRAWPSFAVNGYGLANVASTLGIAFQHHAAQEDARAAGEIFLRAIIETKSAVADWVVRIGQPMRPTSGQSTSRRESASRKGNSDGALVGETIVFTGSLSLSRQRATDLAAEAGCDVASSVTKQTTLLVVGDLDSRQLAASERSVKHRKAEEFLLKGQTIQILGESDFLRLIELG